jgi:hypothetical protein
MCVCTHNEFYSAIRKNEITGLGGEWMKLEDIVFREVSQVQNDKAQIFSLLCGK